VSKLEWRHINFDKGTVNFHNTKNDEQRLVSMPQLLTDALRMLHTEAKLKGIGGPGDKVFRFETRTGFYQMVKRLQKRAGLSTAPRPHDMGRHAFGAHHANSGMSRAELMQAGNWKSDEAAKRYEHIRRDRVTKAADTSQLEIQKPVKKPVT
jgi:integrase